MKRIDLIGIFPLTFGWALVRALRSGVIKARDKVISRSDHPVKFWSFIVVLIIGILAGVLYLYMAG